LKLSDEQTTKSLQSLRDAVEEEKKKSEELIKESKASMQEAISSERDRCVKIAEEVREASRQASEKAASRVELAIQETKRNVEAKLEADFVRRQGAARRSAVAMELFVKAMQQQLQTLLETTSTAAPVDALSSSSSSPWVLPASQSPSPSPALQQQQQSQSSNFSTFVSPSPPSSGSFNAPTTPQAPTELSLELDQALASPYSNDSQQNVGLQDEGSNNNKDLFEAF